MSSKIGYILLGLIILISCMPFGLGFIWSFNNTDFQHSNYTNDAGAEIDSYFDDGYDGRWDTPISWSNVDKYGYIYENFTIQGYPINFTSLRQHNGAALTSTNISYWNYTLNYWQNLTSTNSSTILINGTYQIPDDGIYNLTSISFYDKLMIKTGIQSLGGGQWNTYYEGGIFYGNYFPHQVSHNSSNINSVVGENITFTLQLNSTGMTTINATLYFNDTSYSVPLNGYSNVSTQANVTKSILMPVVSSQTLLPFYWNYTINGFENVTYKANQTVSPMSLTIGSGCAAGLNVSFNMTFADEINQTRFSESIKYNFFYGYNNNTQYQAYGEIIGVNSFAICINSSVQNNYSIGYGEIEYSKENWATRKYYIFDGTRATNITNNLTLYSLDTAHAIPFQFIAKDYLLNYYSGYYIALMKWYPENNTYRIVEMSRTNEQGIAIMNVELNYADYRVALYDSNGVLIKLDSPTKMVCLTAPCTYNLNVLGSGSDYTSIMGIQSSITYNSATKIVTFTWNDPSQKTAEMRFYVYKDSGYTYTDICNTTSNLYVGIMNCNITGYGGTIWAKGYRSASPENPLVSKIISIRNSIDKGIGLFVQLILSLLVGLIAVWSPIAAILFSIIPFAIGFVLGTATLGVLIGIFIIGGVIIHFIGRAQGK
jgi:hypothetical protein